MNPEQVQIGFFRHYAAPGKNVPLHEFLNGIRDGKWAAQIQCLRAASEPAARDKLKKRLPAFMLSSTSAGGRKAADMLKHSGLLQIDIDHIPEPENLRDRIGDDRHILAAWLSPSGNGVKAIMRIPADIGQHKDSFAAAADYMRETYDHEIDRACSDCGRLCFVSHDVEIVTNFDAVPLELPATPLSQPSAAEGGEEGIRLNLNLHNKAPILHNKLFEEFESLTKIYRQLVERRYGRPQRGQRNAVMVEIISSCFFAVTPEFALAFADEFYNQHAEAFEDYGLEQWQSEARALMAGCGRSFLECLNQGEQAAFAGLGDEKEQTAFRICRSLANCESNATVPPPLFHLSCQQLSARLGVLEMKAWRTLKAFEKSGILEIVTPGIKRSAGKQGVATTYRWLLVQS